MPPFHILLIVDRGLGYCFKTGGAVLCTRVCVCVQSALLPAQAIFTGLVGDAALAQQSRGALAPARVISDPTEISQVRGQPF